MTGDASSVSLLAEDNKKTLYYQFQGAGSFIFRMKIILINVQNHFAQHITNETQIERKYWVIYGNSTRDTDISNDTENIWILLAWNKE